MAFANLKGGTGKTTLCVNIAGYSRCKFLVDDS
ncbi:MAG: ParA family protein [Xenococcaceae cyanobacterium]